MPRKIYNTKKRQERGVYKIRFLQNANNYKLMKVLNRSNITCKNKLEIIRSCYPNLKLNKSLMNDIRNCKTNIKELSFQTKIHNITIFLKILYVVILLDQSVQAKPTSSNITENCE